MNPDSLFCPNFDCPARGQTSEGNIRLHHHAKKRFRCDVCQKTFSATKGTIFYRLKTDPQIVMCVIILLAFGCPVQAIVRAFGFDERTIRSWWRRAGDHCQEVHQRRVIDPKVDLGHVQADEIKVKVQGQSHWMAMAIMVRTRLWLGGVVSPKRDKQLIQQLANQIASMALCRPILLAVDGLKVYILAFRRAFRGKKRVTFGRPPYVPWSDVAIVRVIKEHKAGNFEIRREIVQGCETMIEKLRSFSQKGNGVINTAYIERLNGTFRQRLSPLTRRSRQLAAQPKTIEAGMFIVGCFYNFCEAHDSLRKQLWLTKNRYRWVKMTPAIATGLTDHLWTYHELLTYPLPPPRWTPPIKMGRPTRQDIALRERWCT